MSLKRLNFYINTPSARPADSDTLKIINLSKWCLLLLVLLYKIPAEIVEKSQIKQRFLGFSVCRAVLYL